MREREPSKAAQKAAQGTTRFGKKDRPVTASSRGASVVRVTSRAAARSGLYSILSASFYRPNGRSGELRETLVKLLSTSGSAPPASNKARKSGPESSQELEVEYNRLFVGPGHVCCPPYESVYEKDRPAAEIGLLAGPVVPEVERLYAKAGFRLADSFRDYPDHVAVELEFMGHLCDNESRSGEDEAADWAASEAEFMEGHIARWATRFADSVIASTTSQFYASAATLLKQFVLDEATALRRGG